MAHFAELDDNNIVLRVIVVSDEDAAAGGEAFCESLFGGRWKQTSYNTFENKHRQGGTPFRKNYAGVGFRYDETLDAFIPPQPFPSWSLDDVTGRWLPPVAYPSVDTLPRKRYRWNEPTQSWDEIV